LPERFPFLYHARVKQFDAEILENRRIAESWRVLLLSWDEGAGEPEPGQFLTLRASSFSDPLLRRPFAFSGYESAPSHNGPPAKAAAAPRGAVASVVYQIRGGATRLLSELAPGSRIDAIGPLGRGFGLPGADETPIIAGGGIGLGPLLFLATAMAERAAAEARPAALVALGFRSASLLPSIALPEGTVVCTDDGSAGFRGTPVDWISRNAPPGRARLYGCGPLPMLAALADLAAKKGWPARLSAEQWMACGVGACMGCALPRAKGYQGAEGLPRAKGYRGAEGLPRDEGYLRACADGPVFDSTAIDWRARP
jgi:dihydroorotate dehydrogenase electron transfer subunit